MSPRMPPAAPQRAPVTRKGRKAAPLPPTLEKDHERLGDDLMETYGFTAVRFSQARATMQTEGIPDRLYCSTTRGLAFWWEAKREDGKQRTAQREFEVTVTACGLVYFCGTFEQLRTWFARQLVSGWPAWRKVMLEALGRVNNAPVEGR